MFELSVTRKRKEKALFKRQASISKLEKSINHSLTSPTKLERSCITPCNKTPFSKKNSSCIYNPEISTEAIPFDMNSKSPSQAKSPGNAYKKPKRPPKSSQKGKI